MPSRHLRRFAVWAPLVALLVSTAPLVPTPTATAVVGDRATFSNSSPIQLGPARGSRFVSSLEVSGQPSRIEDVNVTLHGFHAPDSADVDVLLQSPEGTRVMVMSDAIGITNGCIEDLGTYDLTFDDAAPDRMRGAWKSGTFQPYNFNGCEGGDSFVPIASGDELRLFNGEDPNGTWKLFLSDDADWGSSAVDELKRGWSLDLGYPLPPVASGDVQIQGPEGSAFHDARTCAVTADGGTLKYPVKVINTGDHAARFHIKTESPARLYATAWATAALPQDGLGYLTPELAPGVSKTYVVKIKLPAGAGPAGAMSDITLSDVNGTRVDWDVSACAVESAGASTTSSEMLLKAGNQKQVSGSYDPGVTGRTLVPGGAGASFVVTLKNRTTAPKRMYFLLDGSGAAESPECDNIAVAVKDGTADITSEAVDNEYLTPVVRRGGSRKLTITVKATGSSSSSPRGCAWDYWYIWAGDESRAFIEVNLASPMSP